MTGADIKLAGRLADAAGAAIRPFFRERIAHQDKSDASPVTEADRAAELAMRAILAAERPDDGIIGEEYGAANPAAARQWVLDPIDGTVSFMAGRAIFGTLIALMVDGWPVLGIIDQPILKERWLGAAGHPTTLNGVAMRTRPCARLADAVLASTGPQYFDDHHAAHFMALAGQTAHNRIVWGGDCYNYALLASGHLDIVCEAGLKLHDIAALVPVVEGAGGLMCDWRGDPLNAESDGDVLALGDPARLEDALAALGHRH